MDPEDVGESWLNPPEEYEGELVLSAGDAEEGFLATRRC
jgi:hypothetical protein